MLKSSKSGPLKVYLLTISPHNRAILEFFFAGAGRNLFKVVPEPEAEAFVLDNDYPGAKEDWNKYQSSQKPALILSVHSIGYANAIWIPKPLTSKALTEAVDKVYELMGSQQAISSTPHRATPLPDIAPVKPVDQWVARAASPSTSAPAPAANKLRSLVANTPEDNHDTSPAFIPPPTPVLPTDPAPIRPPVDVPMAFDPAENEIPLEELDRPLESTESLFEAEQRWKLMCGDREDIQSPSTWQFDAVLYTPENYLFSGIQNAYRIARDSNQAVQVNFGTDDYALFLPELNLVYSTLNVRSDRFADLCSTPIQTGQIALHIPSSSELASLEQHANNNVDALLDLEAFVWVSSLLTARGRLARGIDINRKLVLKHWPNLTRVEQFPHSMRIAALWGQRPGTLFDIANALNIPQRYVFSFYTAANTLNLFELDQTKLKSREKEKPKENRGLFSRLLKRLLGGGAK